MPHRTIAETLRQSRLLHALKQAEVANKLGMRQSQISTLERGLVSPRLSTVEDVARVLDLELMLVPRQLVPVVKGLVEGNRGNVTEERALYTLDEDDDRQQTKDRDSETS
jgi:transcriptional regulator with XRE-family HTH domain